MSKGNAYLFTGTSGEGRALIAEVIEKGYKISPDKVVMITRDPSGRIVWMEEGNASSGLQHIIDRHGNEFNDKGISDSEIPHYVLEAIHQGNIVGTQGKREPTRPIYEFTYNGETHRAAIQTGDNGYIVSANPRSAKE